MYGGSSPDSVISYTRAAAMCAEVGEDLGVRDGPGPGAPAHEIGREPDREQAAVDLRPRREGESTDDTH